MKRFGGAFGREEAAHLLRRAAFAGSQAEISEAVAAGPEATADRLIGAGLPAPTEVERAIRNSDEPATLAGAILERMVASPAPLHENLALFFHNHFVSALSKVREGRMMLDQLALFRAMGLGSFGELAKAVARDPAMVRYLDLEHSNRTRPNENFARELLELFTVGPGSYTEADIREAARALTGHHLRGGRFAYSAAAHDPGPKTVLGRSGAWTGDDVVGMAASHDATAKLLGRKLARHFIADDPSERVVGEVESAWRRNGGHVARTLREILLSETFFAAEHRFAVTRAPAALIVAAARALGAVIAPIDAAKRCFVMGQSLLDPPTVKGYPGGGRWLNAATLLARRAFVLEALGAGREAGSLHAEVAAVADSDGEQAFAMILGRRPSAAEARALGAGTPGSDRVTGALALIVLHPLFQRC